MFERDAAYEHEVINSQIRENASRSREEKQESKMLALSLAIYAYETGRKLPQDASRAATEIARTVIQDRLNEHQRRLKDYNFDDGFRLP